MVDVFHVGQRLAEQCDAYEQRRAPFIERYGEAAESEPDRMHSAIFQSGRSGPLALLRDLQDTVARNVIGVRRGTTHPGKVIVVGAHYDSWHAGAIDNCTAVGSLLSIADAVKAVPLAYTVVLAGWDAEEIGLTGSYDWAARHADRLGDIVTNVNLEMTAAEAGAPVLRFGTSGAKLTELVRQAAAANGYVAAELPAALVRQISGGILPTDIQPFYSAGIQGFSTFTSTPFYHTPQDVPERVDPAALRRVRTRAGSSSRRPSTSSRRASAPGACT